MRYVLIIVIGGIVLALLLALVARYMNRPPELPADLPGALELARAHYELPAMGAAVITSDSIEVEVTGVRRLGGTEAVTKDDLWHLGSNTKAITATLAVVLQEQGRADLDWTVGDTPNFKVRSEYADVTLRELLQHRGMIPPFTAGTEFEKHAAELPETGTPAQQRLAFANLVLNFKPQIPPGTYQYSNAGYGIAAALLEQRLNAQWDSLVMRQVLRPLGAEARVGWPASAQDKAQPMGHADSGFGLEVNELDSDYYLPASIAPAGDLSMSLEDYGKFVQLHLRGLRGQPTDVKRSDGTTGPLLAPPLFKLLHEANGEYSLGWIETEFDGEAASGHEGSAGTFYCTTMLVPAWDVAVVVVANAGSDKAARACREVSTALLESDG